MSPGVRDQYCVQAVLAAAQELVVGVVSAGDVTFSLQYFCFYKSWLR